MRRFLSGTPPIVGMLAMQDTLAMIEDAGIGAIRAKSVALTEFAVRVVGRAARAARRGGGLSARPGAARRPRHALAPLDAGGDRAAVGADVIPDYRDPDGLRIGLSPLSTSFAETLAGHPRGRRRARAGRLSAAGPSRPPGARIARPTLSR